MTAMAEHVLDEKRQLLLRQKLGALLDWKGPEIVRTVGPFEPSVFAHYDEKRQDTIAQCRRQLCDFSNEEIEALVASTAPEHGTLRTTWRSCQQEAITWLTRHSPTWYAGGFGHPDHVANFEYWAKMPTFTVEEATCLSMGIEPDEFPRAKLKSLIGEDSAKIGAALQYLQRNYVLLSRRFDPTSSGWRVQPKVFLTWAEQVEFAVHPDFLLLLQKYHAEQSAGSAQNGAHSNYKAAPDKREIDKIAQLFTALAIDFLGYVPKQARSPIPKEIAEIAGGMGLEVSTDTVLKYLRHGASFIPEGWEPKTR
jgi:hypothetical protein